MPKTRVVSVAMVLAVGWLGSAHARDPSRWDLELELGQFLSQAETDSDSRDTLYGVGVRRWLGESWSLGLAGRVLDVEEGAGESLEVYFVDLTGGYRVFDAESVDLVVLGGPGLFRVEFEEGPQSESTDELTLHAGLGARVDLGKRAFLRPEVRGRWIDGVLDDEIHAEVGVAFGIRLGSGR